MKHLLLKSNMGTVNRLLLIITLSVFCVNGYAQDSLAVTPKGILSSTGNSYIVINIDGLTSSEIMGKLKVDIKRNNPSPELKIEEVSPNTLIVSDLIPGFTKTDKTAGSAFLLDLSYNITFDIKDGKVRYNTPVFTIAANQKYDSQAVIVNKGVQFTVSMGIIGKADLWNSKAKKFFIFSEKGKLIEKSSKEKLEKLFNSYIQIIQNATKASDNW